MIVLTALFVALAVSIGYVLATVPNVELFTATIFIAGFLLGSSRGAVAGAIAEFVFAVIHPFGTSAPPLLMAQMVAMAIVGWTGGIVGRWQAMPANLIVRMIILAGIGFVLTLVFDILTTLSFVVFIADLNLQKIIATFTFGSLFYFVHLGVNTCIFATFVPVIIYGLRFKI